MTNYLVRQYRPSYVNGFANQAARDVAYDDITKVPWAENFKHDGFTHFVVEPYEGNELIISAKYTDGKSWVVGFALPMES